MPPILLVDSLLSLLGSCALIKLREEAHVARVAKTEALYPTAHGKLNSASHHMILGANSSLAQP